MRSQLSNSKSSALASVENPLFIGVQEKEILTLKPEASVLDAVQMMRDRHIGDVIIAEERNGEKIPLGIVTDRDLTLDVLAQCADPAKLQISAVMNKNLVTCPFHAGVFEMIKTMKMNGITRLPLVSDTGALKGIVNAKNLIQLLLAGLYDLSHISEKQQSKEQSFSH